MKTRIANDAEISWIEIIGKSSEKKKIEKVVIQLVGLGYKFEANDKKFKGKRCQYRVYADWEPTIPEMKSHWEKAKSEARKLTIY